MHLRHLALPALLLITAASSNIAQESAAETPADSATTPLLPPHPQLAQTLEAVSQIAVLIPGQGLAGISLGERFVVLQKKLGKPHKSRKSGVLRPRQHWAYFVQGDSVLEFIGKQNVLRIRAHGKATSIFRTKENLNFQAKAADVVRVYGKPAKTRKQRLYFPQRGVDFQFNKDGRLEFIELYPVE